MKEKIVIYQIFTRLYGNRNTTRKEGGTIEENGCGKLNDFTPSTLKKIREMGVSHISSAMPHRQTTLLMAFPVSILQLSKVVPVHPMPSQTIMT